jgi:hypothetical protein
VFFGTSDTGIICSGRGRNVGGDAGLRDSPFGVVSFVESSPKAIRELSSVIVGCKTGDFDLTADRTKGSEWVDVA